MIRRSLIAAIAVLALVAAGCGDDPDESGSPGAGAGSDGGDSGSDGPPDAPSEPGELVLLVELEGAFTTMEASVQMIPQTTVYADGTVIEPGPQIMIYPGPALPAVNRSVVDATTLGAIADAAREAELDTHDVDYGQPPIADAGDTVVTVTIDGEDFVHRAPALGADVGLGGSPDVEPAQAEARDRLSGFLAEVGDLIADGLVEEPAPYDADRYRLLVRPADEMGVEPDMDPPPPVEWDVEGVDLSRADCLPVEGDAADDLVALLSDADALTRFTAGGQEWAVIARPVLPHEDTCPEV